MMNIFVLAPLCILPVLVFGLIMIGRVRVIFRTCYPPGAERPPCIVRWPRHRFEAWFYLAVGSALIGTASACLVGVLLLLAGVDQVRREEIFWFQSAWCWLAGGGILANLCGFTTQRFDGLNRDWTKFKEEQHKCATS